MMHETRWVRRWMGLTLLLLAIPVMTPLPAQESDEAALTGTLHLVWGDPQQDGDPRYTVLLTDEDGVMHPLTVDARDELLVASLIRSNGQRVTVRTRTTTMPRLLAGANAGVTAPTSRELTTLVSVGNSFTTAKLTTPAWAVTARPYAVILCKFSDIATEPLPRQRYVDMYANAPGGTDAFFREASRGRLTMEGTRVFGWYTLPKPRADYTDAAGEARLSLMATDCLATADADVDFSQFGGIGTHYNSRIGCCSWGGSSTVSLDGPSRNMPFMWNMDWARSGTVAHEAGHSFGLPHSSGPYGAVYDSQWDVMSSASGGSYLNADFGRLGSQFMGAYKDRLGLIPDSAKVVLTTGRWSGVIEPHSRAAGRNPQLIVLPLASSRSNIWMTIEARQRVGTDRSIPSEGVLLATVDNGRSEPAQVVDVDGNGDTNDPGAVWTVGERYEDPVRGVVMTVDSLTANGPAITVERTRNGSGINATLARFARSGTSVAYAASDTTLRRDSVQVLATGSWAITNTAIPSWLQLFRRSGTGNGWVVYGIRPSVASLGRSVTLLQLPTPGGLSPQQFSIELGVTSATAPDAVLWSRRGQRITLNANGMASNVDTVRLQLTGSWSTATWSMTASSNIQATDGSGLTFTTRSGTGSALTRVRRALRQTAGLSIDTLQVTVTGPAVQTLLLVDTVEYIAITNTVTLGTRRGALSVSLGTPPQFDSVQVRLGNSAATWTASRRRDAQLMRASGFDGDWLIWTRPPNTVIVSIDTITVQSSDGGTARFVDTLTVRDAPVRVVLSRTGGSRTVTLGRLTAVDSVMVGILGLAGASQTWTANSGSPSLVLHRRDAFIGAATGARWNFVRFSRDLTMLAPGRYIDTIRVNVPGAPTAPALFIDTTTVTAPSVVAGDADLNGTVNAADATTVLRSLVQLPVSSRANVRTGGDANCDGMITVADAVILLQIDAGVVPATNCVGRPGS